MVSISSVAIFAQCHAELGGIAIAPPPKLNLEQLKPGFIMKPSFGVVPRLIDDNVCNSIFLYRTYIMY